MYDMKPNAPVEIRGEFQPIHTNVPGFDICDLMPLQAKMADKLALVRSMPMAARRRPPPAPGLHRLSRNPTARPSFGSIVSRVRTTRPHDPLPPYVSMAQFPPHPVLAGHEEPTYVGRSIGRSFPDEAGELMNSRINYTGPGAGEVQNLAPTAGVTRDRLANLGPLADHPRQSPSRRRRAR